MEKAKGAVDYKAVLEEAVRRSRRGGRVPLRGIALPVARRIR